MGVKGTLYFLSLFCNNIDKILFTMLTYGNREALECYDNAIALNRNDSGALYNMGAILMKMEQYKDACISIKKALALGYDDVSGYLQKLRLMGYS